MLSISRCRGNTCTEQKIEHDAFGRSIKRNPFIFELRQRRPRPDRWSCDSTWLVSSFQELDFATGSQFGGHPFQFAAFGFPRNSQTRGRASLVQSSCWCNSRRAATLGHRRSAVQHSLSFRPANASRRAAADLPVVERTLTLVVHCGRQLFHVLGAGRQAAGCTLVAVHHGRAGRGQQLGRLFAVPRSCSSSRSAMARAVAFHRAGDGASILARRSIVSGDSAPTSLRFAETMSLTRLKIPMMRVSFLAQSVREKYSQSV